MFYIKSFIKSVLRQPAVFLLMFLAMIVATVGAIYFFEDCKIQGGYDADGHYAIEFKNLPSIAPQKFWTQKEKGCEFYGGGTTVLPEHVFAENCIYPNEYFTKQDLEQKKNIIVLSTEDALALEQNSVEISGYKVAVGSEININGAVFTVVAIGDDIKTQIPFSSEGTRKDCQGSLKPLEKMNIFQKISFKKMFNMKFVISQDVVFMFVMGVACVFACVANICILFMFQSKSNCRRYLIYRTLGATKLKIAVIAFMELVVVAILGFIIGSCLGFGIISYIFGEELIKLTILECVGIFCLVMVGVIVAYFVGYFKVTKKSMAAINAHAID